MRSAPVLVAALLAMSGCAGTASKEATFVVASTTSTQDSGLLDSLIPAFEKDFAQHRAKVVAVGSGEAIELARKGDADVLLAHSPVAEIEFMKSGKGIFRRPVMSNDFIIAGPSGDPREISEESSAERAFEAISRGSSTFVSRGDESGTHVRELEIWKQLGITPSGEWYLSTGQGMAESLMIADQKGAYLLTDTATFGVFSRKIDLRILFEGDDDLDNPYSVIPVKGARNASAARDFATWITDDRGQSFIGSFGIKQFGRPLFFPEKDDAR